MTRQFRAVAVVSMALTSAAWAGTEGSSSTFYGTNAGGGANADSGLNTFIGFNAGAELTNGTRNTFVGREAGRFTTTGDNSTVIGALAGGKYPVGFGNVFVGYAAGYSETGSNRLYIDNCVLSDSFTECTRPFIYGEFDNRLLDIDGIVHVTANRMEARVESQLHFSVTGSDTGGWMTSAADNNFFISSGARYDADAGGWIQRSPDGKSVISGSGAVGFRVLTSSGGAVGSAVAPVSRLHIDYDGAIGVNTAPVAGRAINTSTGAYLTSGGMWVNASSRALKSDIEPLSAEDAQQAFARLEPVRFRYNADAGSHVGFIAEDVPDLVATDDRKGLSSMEVVAVLTKVVQQQSRQLEAMSERLRQLESR